MKRKWGHIVNDIKKLEKLALLEIVCLPLYLYAYETSEALFWILLILVDGYELKQLDLKSVLHAAMQTVEDQSTRILMILSIGYACALGIVAYKNLALAGVLIINELLLMLAAFANVKNKDKK